jgi:ketosteroid isomerase-like protein
MSQENVEIVRRYYEATERGFRAYWDDPRSAEEVFVSGELAPEGAEMVRWLHPNVEWKTLLTGVTYRGYVGLAHGFDELMDAASDYRIEVKEVVDLGGEHVLATVESTMTGKASDIGVNVMVFALVTVREGLIVGMDEYLERDQALEAAGLRE